MPVIHNFQYNEIPEWSVLKKWEIYDIPVGSTFTIETGYGKCGVWLLNGYVTVDDGSRRQELWRRLGQDVIQFCFCASGTITVECHADDNWWNTNKIAVFSGDWADDEKVKMGGFSCANADHPFNHGDPVDFPFFTTFPNHYHEFDEYFLIMRGNGVFMDDGVLYNVGPGDLVATQRGRHHMVAAVWSESMNCAEFGSRYGGRGRNEFLYEHTHGKPEVTD